MWDFAPTWQNTLDSLRRAKLNSRTVGAFKNDMLIGYGIIEPQSGDIPQLAVTPEYRRKKIATCLFQRLVGYAETGTVKVINSNSSCASFTSFLCYNGMPPSGSQFELWKPIE
jgi:hypothetical protein